MKGGDESGAAAVWRLEWSGGLHFEHQSPRKRLIRSTGKGSKMAENALRGGVDCWRVALENAEAQKLVVMGRLLVGRDPQPRLIDIERIAHVGAKPCKIEV